MYKKVSRIKLSVVEEVVEVQCNQCGRSSKMSGLETLFEANDYNQFSAGGGYGSTFPGDMSHIIWVMCGACTRKLVEGFKIPPTSEDSSPEPFVVVDTRSYTEKLVNYGVLTPTGSEPSMEDIDRAGELLGDWQCDVVVGDVYKCGLGEIYQVRGAAVDVSSLTPMILYQELFGESNIWARPVSDFLEKVEKGDFSRVSLDLT